MPQLSDMTKTLKQSGIRSASIRCNEVGGINLGQGICDLPVHPKIKQAACDAINMDHSRYSACDGVAQLKEAIAAKASRFNQINISKNEVMVGHGATGVFVCTMMALFNPGDEVVIFEPFYGYHKNILDLQNIKLNPVSINVNDFTINFDKLEAAITPKTRGIVICTPNNPSGKVFSQDELMKIADLAKIHDLYIITDEIYEYVTYPGHEHYSIASFPGCFERTVTISGFSKTYNMTGWRLGYAIANADIIEKMSLINDSLYVCASTPLQHAVVDALSLPDSYYQDMAEEYLHKRELVVNALRDMGFQLAMPQGAYYLLADFSKLPFDDDLAMSHFLLEKAKVATVPGRSFYINPEDGMKSVRFCFALSLEKLEAAMRQIKQALNS